MARIAQSSTRYVNVDGLRLLCALAVLLFHYLYRGSLEGLYAPLLTSAAFSDVFKYGHIGVHIFFCISGFVIAYSASGRGAWAFATARFARIYPTFILCLTVLFAARWMWGGTAFPAHIGQYLANFLIMPQLVGQEFMSGVYWSIVTEMIFYGWVFVLLALGVFNRFRGVVIAAWLLVAVVNELVLGQGALRQVMITEFAPFFIFGMVLQRMQEEQRVSLFSGMALATAVALGMAVLLRETAEIRATYGIAMSDTVSMAILLVGLLLLVWAVEARRAALPVPVLAWAGGISYPLYLLHEGLGQVAFVAWRNVTDGPLLFAGVTAGVVALASAIWWGFDRPVVKLLRRRLDGWVPFRMTRLA